MPNSTLNKVSKVCRIPIDKLEESWSDAKQQALDKGESPESSPDTFWRLVMHYFKKSLSKSCKDKLQWKAFLEASSRQVPNSAGSIAALFPKEYKKVLDYYKKVLKDDQQATFSTARVINLVISETMDNILPIIKEMLKEGGK